MSASSSVPALTVIYAKDIKKVAHFYQRTLSLSLVEEAPRFIVVGNAGIEVAVIQMADEEAEKGVISTPPLIRERSAIKCSFLVDNLDHARAEAEASGGGTKPLAAAWPWRDQIHLDGYDPEGNVVQFRQRDARGQRD